MLNDKQYQPLQVPLLLTEVSGLGLDVAQSGWAPSHATRCNRRNKFFIVARVNQGGHSATAFNVHLVRVESHLMIAAAI